MGAPFEDGTAAWVAPTRDGRAALKLGMPHMEAEHELAGLRHWDGDGAVRVLMADEALHAMLLERCEPGTALRREPKHVQDAVIATLLKRLWRRPLTAP